MSTEIVTTFWQICDSAGDPVSGAKINVYAVGTTTPLAVKSDTALSVAAANPIICDSAGRHEMRYIATGSYKIVVTTSADVTIYTRDGIDGRVPVGSGALAIANGGTGATTAGAALTALGGATAAELSDVSAEVAAISGALGSTEKTHLATGTTAQRPGTPAEGDERRNTTTARWEGYNNAAAWENFFTDTEIATTGEAQAGTDNTHVMTPLRTATAITALAAEVKLATLTASSSASLADTTSLTSTYSSYRLVITNLLPATNGVSCRLRLNVAGVQTTGYDAQINATANGSNSVEQATTFIQLSRVTNLANTGMGVSATIWIHNPSQTASPKGVQGTGTYKDSGAATSATFTTGGAYTGGNGAVTGFQVDMSSGNIASGTIRIYGVR